VKISSRLQQINQMITGRYSHIWDCCCDHGLLGMLLLERQVADVVHFVDIVPQLMSEVESKLSRFFPTDTSQPHWQVHCGDVAKLSLARDQDRPQLVIIAGVGGELLIELVNGILADNPGLEFEFLLCPVRQNYQVRKAMTESGLSLLNEKLVSDNNRFYEVLHLTNRPGKSISVAGDDMWDFNDPAHLKYLNRTLEHYIRMQNSPQPNAQPIIETYKALIQKANQSVTPPGVE